MMTQYEYPRASSPSRWVAVACSATAWLKRCSVIRTFSSALGDLRLPRFVDFVAPILCPISNSCLVALGVLWASAGCAEGAIGDNSVWGFVSVTGNFGATSNSLGTNVDIYLQAAGEAYIDDVSLVPLSGPYAGMNLVQNGDFEAPLSVGPWLVPPSMANSVITNTYAHSGSSSLHMVATNGGSVFLGTVIKQPLPAMALSTNILCTLSFWYRANDLGTNVFVRTFPGSSLVAIAAPMYVNVSPASWSVLAGSNATFTGSAGGTAPLSYQWQFNGMNLAGATNLSFVLTNVRLANAGNYALVVSNPYQTMISSNAVLAVTPLLITVPPQNQAASQGTTVTSRVTVQSLAPVRYQWLFNGTNLPGATNTTLFLTNLQSTQDGIYSVAVANVFGAVISSNAVLVVMLPLAQVLDTNSFSWTTSGNAPWFGQAGVSHGAWGSARSGILSNSQQSVLQTTVTGPGTVSFWWKVSSQAGSDYLSFLLNGVVQTNISGEADWAQQTFFIPSGSQTLQWAYVKDAGGSSGKDAGWVDQVSFTPGNAPVLMAQPRNQTVLPGGSASFGVAVGGAQPLAYQWRKDGVALADAGNIAGALTASLTVSNLSGSDTGNYTALVSNSYGTATSAVASLTILLPADVSIYSVIKGIHYTQTGTSLPVAKTNNGYVFEADVRFLNNTVTNATVQPPLGTNHVLPPRVGYSELRLEHKYDTTNSLETHYPDGWYTNRIYTVDNGTKTLPLLLQGAAYPIPPHLTDFPTLQMVYNNGYFMAAWDPFVGATTNDTIEFHIEDTLGDPVWDPPHEGALPPDRNELLVYAHDFYNEVLGEQVYKGTLIFRKVVTVDTNAYPGAIGEAYYYAETSFNLLLSTNPSPDVAWYEVSKARRFTQTDADFPAPDIGQPYQFQAAVQAYRSNLLSSATILLPNSTLEPVMPQGDGLHFAWAATASSQSALDASYGNGLYTFTLQTVNDGNRSVALPLSANSYPPSPHVANFEATQGMLSDQDFNLAWDPWVDGTASDFVQLRIEDLENNKYFETPDPGKPGALDGRATAATVKAGTLAPGRSWVATIVFKTISGP